MTSTVKLKGRLIEATFLSRPNRFLAIVKVNNKTLPSFVPNPGRMHELLKLGTKVVLRELKRDGRKTDFDLIGVFHKGQKISVDSRVPNKLVWTALERGEIKELADYTTIKLEYNFDHVRFDFFLTNHSKPCLLEVKSCTLVENGKALFPDAITVRGRKHVEKLTKAVDMGYRACILFIVQRTDARAFSPNDKVDSKFGIALRVAVEKGVDVYAYSSEFFGNRIILRGELGIEW